MRQPDTHTIAAISADLRAALGDDFDQTAFLDTLDGETDVMDILGALIDEVQHAETLEAAAREMVAKYTARAKRFDARVTAIRNTIGQIMDATGERKIAHPLATLSRTEGKTKCRIVDSSAIPSQLCTMKPVPDTDAIKAAILAGETVPGAELMPPERGIAMRVK